MTEQQVPPILSRFMYGQFANLFKFAIWWTALAPLTYALLGSAQAIGVGRIVYNVALCLFSPLAGSIVERVHPRSVLLRAAAVRFAIWVVLVPLSWVLFDTLFVSTYTNVIYVLLNVGLFFDGIAVAWSSILDIDVGGIDITSGVYSLDVTDEMRAYFNTRQEFVFAVCFIVFAPGLAFVGLGLHKAFLEIKSDYLTNKQMEAGALTTMFAAAFIVGTFFQWLNFRKMPFEKPNPEGEGEGGAPSDNRVEESGVNREEPPQQSLLQTAKAIPGELKEALLVLKHNKFILFRLLFLGLEIAFEDAIIVVIAAQMGLLLPWLGDKNAVDGNIWTSVAVSIGKIGGALASLLMMKFYDPPKQAEGYRHLFVLIFLSTLMTLIFPSTVYAYENGKITENGARILYFAGFFFYFFLSTLPKLGLMGLLQSMVAEVENGARVFGFIAIVATACDALIIMLLSEIFMRFHTNIQYALWVSSGIYLLHGVLELITGPILVLRPLAAKHQHAVDSAEGTKETAPLVSGDNIGITGYDGTQEKPSEDNLGTYSQASVAVSVPRSRSPGRTDGDDSVQAVLATSGPSARYGSVRRRSQLTDPDSPRLGSPRGYTRTGSALTPRK